MTFSTSSMVETLGVDVVGHDLAPAQHHDAVDHLEHVVDVVRDEDAGAARVARVAHEPEHALRLGHAEVAGGLVEVPAPLSPSRPTCASPVGDTWPIYVRPTVVERTRAASRRRRTVR